jgi:hypothetical protein
MIAPGPLVLKSLPWGGALGWCQSFPRLVPGVVLGLANDAEDKLGELWRWLEQRPAVQGAGSDFDHGA